MEQRDRTLVIPRFLADQLAGHTDGDGLIFTSPDRTRFARRTSSVGCGVPLWPTANWAIWVPHDLRYTAASLAISAGASVKAVQRMLGHASAQVTLDRYSHLNDDDLEDLADSMDPRYGAAQVRPKPESDEVFHIQKRHEKAT
ncbi:MAG TPA: tyrosine-type recombinase/integrase [Acidimicrobiia bacterium]